jgi:hypothetical protein
MDGTAVGSHSEERAETQRYLTIQGIFVAYLNATLVAEARSVIDLAVLVTDPVFQARIGYLRKLGLSSLSHETRAKIARDL